MNALRNWTITKAVRLLIVLISVCILILQELYINIGEFTTTNHVIRVSPWISYSCGILIALILFFVDAQKFWSKVARNSALLICFVMFVSSVHFFVLNASNGEVREYWSGVRIAEANLVGINDEAYCYTTTAFMFQLNGKRNGQKASYFRGVWPSNISDADLKNELIEFEPCSK